MTITPNAIDVRHDRIAKVVAALCFFCISVAVLLAGNTAATGYELSIYASTPLVVWTLLLVCAVGGAWLVANRVFGETKSIPLGLVVGPVALAHAALLLMPALRGYFLYGTSDTLVHLGRGLDILSSGHTDSQNFYPTLHILIAQLSLICGIPLDAVGRFLPIFLSLVFGIASMYLVAKVILPIEGQALLAVALASGFLLNSLHVMIYSQVFAFLPLLLVLYLRLDKSMRQCPEGRILLILLLLFIPYSHPTTALETVFLFLAIEFADSLYRRLSPQQPPPKISFTLPLISAIIFFTWISSFLIFGRTVESLLKNTLGPLQGIQLHSLETALTSTEAPLGMILKVYGDSFVCLVLATAGAVILVIKVLSGQDELRNLWAVTALWLIALPLEVFIFVGTGRQTVGRLANLSLAIFLSPLLAGFALHGLLSRARKAIAVLAAVVLLLAVWTIGAAGTYHSPWILQPSWQITQQDVRGTEWFVEHKADDLQFSGMGYNYGLPSIVLGFQEAYTREDLTSSAWQMRINFEHVLPVGFGYERFRTLGESLGETRYLVVAESFRLATAHPTLGKKGLTVIPLFFPGFRSADFERLGDDPTANKLYSNGQTEIWHIHARSQDD